MSILGALKKDRLGDWPTIAEYLTDLRRRETNSVAALALALAAAPEDQRELAGSGGLSVLVEVASDLRIPKTSRVAALRCAIEAGVAGEDLAALFVGAGDLATDPRLGDRANRFVEGGVSAALKMSATHRVSLQAGSFARAAHAAAVVAGRVRIEELLATAPPDHAGKLAATFALGAAPLPAAHQQQWANLLRELCVAHRRAPEAARRLGLIAAWPPNLPSAFSDLMRQAEQAAAHVTSQGAATGEVKRPAAPAAARISSEAPSASPEPPRQAHAAGPIPAAKSSLPQAPSRATLTEVGKKMAPPIRPSLFRRPTGTVTEGPVRLPPKPMPPVALPPPSAQRARAGGKQVEPPRAQPTEAGSDPVLVRKARAAEGPFAARLASLFDDRPEAVERLCAAVEARGALGGVAAALEGLERELARARWKERRASPEQKDRLGAMARSGHVAWSAAAKLVLEHV